MTTAMSTLEFLENWGIMLGYCSTDWLVPCGKWNILKYILKIKKRGGSKMATMINSCATVFDKFGELLALFME